ncbi:MAG: hypothetical protein MUF64_15830, partial [Polyangiaceae bacterium]|nr:hypothetical protein [Polyangiaceae bacterium]
MRTRTWLWLSAPLLLSLSCTTLPEIPAAACGNKLVETEREDCDGDAPASSRCAAPGEAHACRYVCADATGASYTCPTGYRCGGDGVCRQPTGVFQQAGRSIEVGATELQSGDFDDNKQAEVLALGTKDILERAPTQVLFFSEDLERATAQPIPGLLGAPVVGRFTNSPYDGLAFGSLPGMAMLIGRRDRQFFPRSYPTFETPPDVTDARIYFVDFFANQGPVSGSPFPTDFPVLYSTLKGPQGELHELFIADLNERVAQMPAGPSELQGDLVMGILNEQLPCPTAVAGYKNID